jgi:hypothetical protein
MVIPVLLWSDFCQHRCHHTPTPFSMWSTTLCSFQTMPGATLHKQCTVAWLTLLLSIIQVLSSSLYIFVMLNEYPRIFVFPWTSLFYVPSRFPVLVDMPVVLLAAVYLHLKHGTLHTTWSGRAVYV